MTTSIQANQPIQPTTVASKKPMTSNKISEASSGDLNPERKFNVVVYGIKEFPPNTCRYNRSQNDSKELSKALPDINFTSNKDFYRLGKFKTDQKHARPILINFLRALDATSLLSSRSKFNPPVVIKPDMTAEERNTESLLLRE